MVLAIVLLNWCLINIKLIINTESKAKGKKLIIHSAHRVKFCLVFLRAYHWVHCFLMFSYVIYIYTLLLEDYETANYADNFIPFSAEKNMIWLLRN